MNLNDIRFPIEGNVQNLVHFMETNGAYSFTFGSPFCYQEPAELKAKNAFLLASFNHLKKKSLSAESVFTYYINDEDRKNHPDPSIKASVRGSRIFRGDGTPLGRIDVLLQRGLFRRYAGLHANPVYDPNGVLTGFCHYDPAAKSKDAYLCGPSFSRLSEPLNKEMIDSLTAEGSIRHLFSYDIVESEEADNKDRFMAIFSPSKKSELSNNRIRYFGAEEDTEKTELMLTALFAFFWGTYIDIPLS